ncbi:MAG: RIP metalloprotease RseP [Pseudomonadota bacterium]|mgnify:FL=1
MTGLPLTIAAFIVALGVLITVHEFGHFWVARLLGVKVLRFSIGFGRPLWRREIGRDRMEFVLAWIPLGGYVKMLDEREGEVAPADRPRAFNRQPLWKRSLVVLAGPAFNFLFAILVFWVMFMAGVSGIKPVVGHVTPDSLAARAGFKAGETLVSIDRMPVQSWNQHRLYVFRRALEREPVQVVTRDAQGVTHDRTIDLTNFPLGRVNATLLEQGLGLYGYIPPTLPEIGAVEKGKAGERAGLRAGDRLLAVDGKTFRRWPEFVERVNASAGKLLRLTIERGGQTQVLTVTPEAFSHNGQTIGRLYVYPQYAPIPEEMRARVQHGPIAALNAAAGQTWGMSWLTLEMLYHMLRLEVSTKNLSGPLTIAQYAGESARIGLEPFVLFLAIISISLGVLNLLPIPVLDGGHLLYFAIEAIIRRPVPERVLAIGQQVGLAMLAALMFLAIYNDLTRIFR